MELPLERETEGFEKTIATEGFENNLWKGFCRTEGVVKTIDKEEFKKQREANVAIQCYQQESTGRARLLATLNHIICKFCFSLNILLRLVEYKRLC